MWDTNAGETRVLIIEDEPAISEICRRVLNKVGLEVDIAPDGVVAQDIIKERDYALCIIDIRTPVMDGREFYQVVLETYPQLAEKVIFTTGDIEDSDTWIFLEKIGKPILAKPFTPGDLIREVEIVLGK